MLRNLVWQASDHMTRVQLAMFHKLGDQISLTNDELRRALNLDSRSWIAWEKFLADGPLPAHPPLPVTLRLLAETTYNLVVAHRP